MGIISSLIEKRSYSEIDDYWYYPVYQQTASGIDVDESNSLEFPDVYKCVRVIAETIAALPLFVYRRLPNGGKEKAADHPLNKILHLKPNTEMTSFQFRETEMNHLLTWGNFYAQIEMSNQRIKRGLWPLRPDRMEVEKGRNDLIQYRYKPTDGSEDKIFPSDEILHIPGLGFNGITGYSPIAMAREAIGLGMAASEYAARFFSNDATPPIFLKHPMKLSPQGHENLKKSWIESYGGLKNKGKPAILEEGLDVKTIGIPMKDAQFLELRKFQRTEICGIYRVPPHMIAETEASTSWGTGIEQQTIGFVIYTIMPWLVRLEQAYAFKLFTEEEQDEYFVEHLLHGLMRGDSSARATYYKEMFNIGVFSINQILELENMNPIGPQGDIHYVQMNLMPVNPPKKAKEEPQILPNSTEEEEKLIEEGEKSAEEEKAREAEQIKLKAKEEIEKAEKARAEAEKARMEAKEKVREAEQARKETEVRTKEIEKERLASSFKRIMEDAAARVVRRESIAIHRALKRQDLTGFESHLEGFYRKLPEFMGSTLHPAITSYAELMDSTGALNCLSAYIDNHIKESKNEISKWIGVYVQDSTDFRKNEQAIDDCLDLWQEKRPEQAAIAIQTYFATS